MKNFRNNLIYLLVIIGLVWSCTSDSGDDPDPTPTTPSVFVPSLTVSDTALVYTGDIIKLSGSFGTLTSSSVSSKINQVEAPVTNINSTQLRLEIPKGITSNDFPISPEVYDLDITLNTDDSAYTFKQSIQLQYLKHQPQIITNEHNFVVPLQDFMLGAKTDNDLSVSIYDFNTESWGQAYPNTVEFESVAYMENVRKYFFDNSIVFIYQDTNEQAPDIWLRFNATTKTWTQMTPFNAPTYRNSLSGSILFGTEEKCYYLTDRGELYQWDFNTPDTWAKIGESPEAQRYNFQSLYEVKKDTDDRYIFISKYLQNDEDYYYINEYIPSTGEWKSKSINFIWGTSRKRGSFFLSLEKLQDKYYVCNYYKAGNYSFDWTEPTKVYQYTPISQDLQRVSGDYERFTYHYEYYNNELYIQPEVLYHRSFTYYKYIPNN